MKVLKNLEIEWVTSAKYPIQQGAKAAITKEDDVAEPTKAELQKELDDFKAEIVKEREETAEKLSKAADDLVKANERIAELEKAAESEVKPIYKSLADKEYHNKESAELAKELDIERLEKEALAEYSHLPGEDNAKARVLLMVKSWDEADRNVLETMLKSGEAAMAKTASTTRATMRKGEGASANDQLNTLAKEYQKEKNVDFYKAYDEMRKVHPDLYEQAVNEGRP